MANQKLYSVGTDKLPKIEAKIFIQDPMVARETESRVGTKTVKLEGEAYLGAGPTTSRIAVVDFNADLDELFAPVTPLARGGGFSVGGGRPEGNFKFHQVNVWAVITHILNLLEGPGLFGRRIPWAFPGGRLLVLPHAGYWENAFYDRDSGALHFFYFEGDEGPVFTCLSHDIVAHELGHAVLDGLKPYYNEIDTAEAAGFHEYFGDAIAMVSALTMPEVLGAVVQDRPSRLQGPNLVSDIAREFGSALFGDSALRSGVNNKRMADVRKSQDEYAHSEVLSGAFYDVLQKLYGLKIPKMKERFKKRKLDGQVAIAALISAARQTSRLMLRALDYCPPAGLTFLDYARAALRADQVAYPVDEQVRKILVDVFRKRGIVGRGGVGEERRYRNYEFRTYDVDEIGSSRTEAYGFLDANRELLEIPRNVNFSVSNLYRTRKESAGGYYPPRELILEFVWSEDVLLAGASFDFMAGEHFPLWCGGTLVFDSDGNVLHYVVKKATDVRKEALKRYVSKLVAEGAFGGEEQELGIGATGAGHRIQVRSVGGRIQARRNPALRHEGRA